MNTSEPPTKIELLTRLIACAAVLELRAQNCAGEYKPYFQIAPSSAANGLRT